MINLPTGSKLSKSDDIMYEQFLISKSLDIVRVNVSSDSSRTRLTHMAPTEAAHNINKRGVSNTKCLHLLSLEHEHQT